MLLVGTEGFYSVAEVSKILKLSPKTVREFIKRDTNPLPAVNLNNGKKKVWRINREDFRNWIQCMEDPRENI